MERVKPGLVKKLTHRWHGPFRIKRKVEEFSYELELPDKSGYRFYPFHVSRLKAVNEFCDRPKARLVQNITEDTRLDYRPRVDHPGSVSVRRPPSLSPSLCQDCKGDRLGDSTPWGASASPP
ncbi:hypothetical protein PHMEG_00034858 [Phytophthora megakarya]|uniref:Tf2-1-like SH3-like domain-containing protein n=1 Tax=Phytophthora megakarya TaxID=4795 RepID=A0A225UQ37_9STRA|nr:hypothetical protein PHMEG_00034858 [Phytophthora megakarya]